MKNCIEINWEESIWNEINETIVMQMGKVRTAQKVFPTVALDTDPEEIPNHVINFTDYSIREGQTKQLVEIYQEFAVTSTQISKEAINKTCKELACSLAGAIALAEDAVIFQGQKAKLFDKLQADWVDSAGNGLLGEAHPQDADNDNPSKVSEPIEVKFQSKPKQGVLYGENTFAAVAEGITRLTSKAQAGKFALFLPVKAYADTFTPPSDASLVITADRIKPLVEGGFVQTVSLPADSGLLVALSGNPVTLYVGREATIECVRREGAKYIFRVVERIQFVAKDPRALVLLKFEQPTGATPSVRTSAS